MSEPTHTIELPTRPAGGFRRPALMSALALSEHLVSAPVPAPVGIRIEAPVTPGGEAVVFIHHYHDLDALFTWQQAFGGEIRHEVRDSGQLYSALSGRAFDAPFEAWTLRRITAEQEAFEQQQLAKWVDEHGAPQDWAAETHTAYCALVLRYRLAVAR